MYKRILVPYDGSQPSRAGLREAIALAADSGATLVVLHVVSEPPRLTGGEVYVNHGALVAALQDDGQRLAQEAAGVAAKAGVTCEARAVDGGADAVCDVILEQIAAQGCDLVVMGTHGRRGLERLALGSDAERVVRRSRVPVLLAKAAESAT
jgi:nucleotide-binding universal stress UspA family protein